MYLLWGDGAPALGDQLRDRLLELAPRLIDSGAHAVTVNVHDSAAAEAPSPVPTPEGEDCHVAEIAIWVDSYDRRGPLEKQIVALGPTVAGYLVVESLYEDYGTTPHSGPRNWEDGRRSPGVLTVSLIHRPEGLDYATWIDRWHGTQSPLSGELQPRCRYVRNEVVRPLTDAAPEIHGIVEEAWPSLEHVTDPMLFYCADGDPERMNAHVTQMIDEITAFVELDTLRSVTMSEWILKS